MTWYIAFRSGSSRVMFLYSDKETAIEAARRVMARGGGDGLEVAPVARSGDAAALTAEDIRRLCEARDDQSIAAERQQAQRLRSLAAWYRRYAEQAAEPHVWEGRLRTAKRLEKEAASEEPRAAVVPAAVE
jgi:molybdopterin-guanine dinucleotide biosynthesis protein A